MPRQKLAEVAAAADAAIVAVARRAVPDATVQSMASRAQYSCMIVVATDDDKRRINGDEQLIQAMRLAAAEAGREPDFLRAGSQETVDRRHNGEWVRLWR